MKRRMRGLSVAAVLAVAWVVPLRGAEKQSARSPDFMALMQTTLAAWETLDPKNPAPFYAKDPDLVFYDITPLRYQGWAEYAEGVTKVLAGFSSLKFTLGDYVRIRSQGNLAWATATWHADAVAKSGSKEGLDGRWTVVWEKRGKDWLIVHEHFSVPLPTPGDAMQRP